MLTNENEIDRKKMKVMVTMKVKIQVKVKGNPIFTLQTKIKNSFGMRFSLIQCDNQKYNYDGAL